MGLRQRLATLFRRHPKEPALTPDTPGLVVVVRSFDVAEAPSTALDRAADWRADEPAVLRHYLRIPADEVQRARETLAQDDWQLRVAGPDVEWPSTGGSAGEAVLAVRVQRLDAMHCAQEDSRMAGLSARLGGDHLGWDAQQPG